MKMFICGIKETSQSPKIYCFLTTNPEKKFKSILCGKDQTPLNIDKEKTYELIQYKEFEGDDFKQVNRQAQIYLADLIQSLGEFCVNLPIIVKPGIPTNHTESHYKYEYRLNCNTVLCSNTKEGFDLLKKRYNISEE